MFKVVKLIKPAFVMIKVIRSAFAIKVFKKSTFITFR